MHRLLCIFDFSLLFLYFRRGQRLLSRLLNPVILCHIGFHLFFGLLLLVLLYFFRYYLRRLLFLHRLFRRELLRFLFFRELLCDSRLTTQKLFQHSVNLKVCAFLLPCCCSSLLFQHFSNLSAFCSAESLNTSSGWYASALELFLEPTSHLLLEVSKSC
jgi:hypothetical protein